MVTGLALLGTGRIVFLTAILAILADLGAFAARFDARVRNFAVGRLHAALACDYHHRSPEDANSQSRWQEFANLIVILPIKVVNVWNRDCRTRPNRKVRGAQRIASSASSTSATAQESAASHASNEPAAKLRLQAVGGSRLSDGLAECKPYRSRQQAGVRDVGRGVPILQPHEIRRGWLDPPQQQHSRSGRARGAVLPAESSAPRHLQQVGLPASVTSDRAEQQQGDGPMGSCQHQRGGSKSIATATNNVTGRRARIGIPR